MRPFVLDEVVLTEIADEENFDLSDRMAITKYLKRRVRHVDASMPLGVLNPTQVNELIEKANLLWDERNERAVAEGEDELPRMLPIVRLKVPSVLSTPINHP